MTIEVMTGTTTGVATVMTVAHRMNRGAPSRTTDPCVLRGAHFSSGSRC
jgi:hypothetical protein